MSMPIQTTTSTSRISTAERHQLDAEVSRICRELEAPYKAQIASMGWDAFALTPEGASILEKVHELRQQFRTYVSPPRPPMPSFIFKK